ncbi:MAG: aminotransferase class I/II-fold pyridoxal phosphate-dependent enzyme [Treponema sp.]|nr:aminotransferase class I/II-fold pyridoxal phosphate-dependent enzyme [Spirochaetales bacterium]MDY6191154.1 aminotransferase class I/II-fold pyridoxal phosphate-dependent enzyme [Treponema sp.]
MTYFTSDYVNGAAPEVLNHLLETNSKNLTGYGSDDYCEIAISKIKKACNKPDADVYFLTGGTQTNQIVISTVLKPFEGVIAANTGHVSGHEAGAIEFSGHKVLQISHKDGKLSDNSIENLIKDFYNDRNHEHMVFPGMVYISLPTEYGTLYSKNELQNIYQVCQKYNIFLYIDGARLGYALASPQNDLSLSDIANLCDAFYIGGTKVGALCGEALIFTKNRFETPAHFITQIKQHGALLAKGRLLGVQFDALFTDNLYYKIGEHGILMAEKLKSIFKTKGFRFYLESPTNQQFIILENSKMEELSKTIAFSFWEKYDENHTVVRFATSWSTTQQDLEELEKAL